MNRIVNIKTLALAAAATAAVTILAVPTAAFAPSKDKPKPTVEFAKSWDAAVAEAKLLNLPIVVHSHGFY